MTLRRPTLRVLAEDIDDSDWEGPQGTFCRRFVKKLLDAVSKNDRAAFKDALLAIPSLEELPITALRSSAEAFDEKPMSWSNNDRVNRLVNRPLTRLRFNVSGRAWRAVCWDEVETVTPWALMFSKRDDDTYDELDTRIVANKGLSWLMPTNDDQLVRNQQSVLARLDEADRVIVRQTCEAVGSLIKGLIVETHDGTPIAKTRASLGGTESACDLELEICQDTHHLEALVDLHLFPSDWSLFERIERIVLLTIQPRMESWVYDGFGYSTVISVDRLRHLATLVESQPAVPLGPRMSHYIDAGLVAESDAVRAKCGVVFVQTRSPDRLPVCVFCAAIVGPRGESPDAQVAGISATTGDTTP